MGPLDFYEQINPSYPHNPKKHRSLALKIFHESSTVSLNFSNIKVKYMIKSDISDFRIGL